MKERRDRPDPGEKKDAAGPFRSRGFAALLAIFLLCWGIGASGADVGGRDSREDEAERRVRLGPMLGGAAAAFGIHEGSHLLFDLAFHASPHLKRVDFHGVPFFAVTPREPLRGRRELIVSSAGFWSQNLTSEWALSRRSRCPSGTTDFQKGVLAFDVVTSAAYGAVALARTGPEERDTRSMAEALGVSEPWVGAMILAPAGLDAYRYVHPESRWAKWSSRAVKIAMVLLVLR